MSGIIGELKAEHRKMKAGLDRVKQHGLFGEEACRELSRVGRILLERLEKTLRIFSRDMESIGTLMKVFFEKYPNGGKGVEFAADFGRFTGMLLNRVSREEKILFEEYRKIALN